MMTSKPSSPFAELEELTERSMQKVGSQMRWSKEKVSTWFMTENPLIGTRPVFLLVIRPEKFERWLDSLIKGDVS